MVVGDEIKQGLLSPNTFLPMEKIRPAGKAVTIAPDADLSLVENVKRS
ncbi:MAG: hypothetical protein WA990_08565 [Rubrobacteraceae bacterium]